MTEQVLNQLLKFVYLHNKRVSIWLIVALTGVSAYFCAVGDRLSVAYPAAMLAVWATLAYLANIRWGDARPQRITWTTWAFIGALTFLSTLKGGAGWASLVAFVYFVQQDAVAYYSWRGYCKPPSEHERRWRYGYWAAAVLSIGMVVAWKTLHMPIYVGAALGVAADAFVLWPTVSESKSQPETEPWWVWATDVLAAALTVVAIRHYSFSSMAYTVYLVVGCGLVASLPLLKWWQTRSRGTVAVPQEHVEGVGV